MWSSFWGSSISFYFTFNIVYYWGHFINLGFFEPLQSLMFEYQVLKAILNQWTCDVLTTIPLWNNCTWFITSGFQLTLFKNSILYKNIYNSWRFNFEAVIFSALVSRLKLLFPSSLIQWILLCIVYGTQ